MATASPQLTEAQVNETVANSTPITRFLDDLRVYRYQNRPKNTPRKPKTPLPADDPQRLGHLIIRRNGRFFPEIEIGHTMTMPRFLSSAIQRVSTIVSPDARLERRYGRKLSETQRDAAIAMLQRRRDDVNILRGAYKTARVNNPRMMGQYAGIIAAEAAATYLLSWVPVLNLALGVATLATAYVAARHYNNMLETNARSQILDKIAAGQTTPDELDMRPLPLDGVVLPEDQNFGGSAQGANPTPALLLTGPVTI